MRSCEMLLDSCLPSSRSCGRNILGGVGLVVHKEEVELADVVDEESLVAGWHQVAGLSV